MADGGRIVVFSGAGVSAESGLRTFRDGDGLWEEYRIEDVATPEAWARDPETVLRFYDMRREQVVAAVPNAAHHAIASLEQAYHVDVVTQNIDDLHERAGSTGVIHMHGELRKALCTRCGARMEWIDDMEVDTPCPACGKTGGMRPDIVWFGEMPYRMEEIESALMDADLFAAIGTSGNVYPAAGFVRTARFAGARTIEFNNAGTAVSGFFEDHRVGPATVEVKRWVDNLLGG